MPLPVPANTRRRLVFLFSVPFAFSLVFFIVEILAERTDIHLLQIQNLQTNIAQLRMSAKDAESGERSFLLTGDDHYLLPLNQAEAILQTQVNFCREYAKDQPTLLPGIDKVAGLLRKRFDEADLVLHTQQSKGFAAAIELTKSGRADSAMDEFLIGVNHLLEDVSREEDNYLRHQRNLNRWTFVFFSTGTLVMIAVMVWLYHALLSYLYARDDAREQLEKTNAGLQKHIEERTRELREMNEELQQFAYVASHDLQEPLRTITSFSQLLAARYQGSLGEDADEFIGYIVTASRRMTDLINGLLQMVRLRRTNQSIAPVSFEKLLEDAKAGLQAAIRENAVEIEHGPLPTLVVDRVQFSQVLQNLLSNAIKYRRDEAPRIRVQAFKERANWTISVSDNGRGFNQDFAERIFGLFQRLHGRDVEGTGMGLSIARKIVERHGGRIWAESVEGAGSTFYFSLPTTLEGLRYTSAAQEAPSAAPVR
ncbi:MAG TPA: ATP-binding protein [Bryobacteraceae bacterium]